MLVLDSFRGHLTENVKLKLRQENCDMVVIPGGMTGMLQPLDVSINRPFKTHLRRLYCEWRCSSTEMTPTGRLKKPSLPQMCEWIVSAWNSIPEEVAKSFKVRPFRMRWMEVRMMLCGVLLIVKNLPRVSVIWTNQMMNCAGGNV
ncbi:hypothetical protein C0J52_09369 [Blattella germanica]|nr:hypothetical protein C0J52_09369 [Blattella germanica]